jgi:hypothetical protein
MSFSADLQEGNYAVNSGAINSVNETSCVQLAKISDEKFVSAS